MKLNYLLSYIFFFISLVSFSQQGISYQAIIKDSDGLVLKDSEVSIKFSIIYDTADSSAVYVEEHQITTPSDGVVNLFIGNGSKLSTGIDFSEIDWSNNVFLKEELDTNGNYETMGTNQIVSVPIAEFSRNTASISTTSNTIQLGNDEVALVNTYGTVSATGFIGDGSRLTNVSLGGSIDENGNLKIVDHSPTMTTSQTNNVLIGSGVAQGLTDAHNNVAIGTSALASATTTHGNIALGSNTLRSSTTAYASSTSSNSSALNVAIGNQAMRDMEVGWVNVAIGSTAMLNTKKGDGNIAIGAGTMEDPSFVEDNIALGTDAIHKRQNMNSIAIGKQALFNVTNVPDESNFAMDTEVSNLQEFIQRTDNPSTTLDESAYGLPGNIAIGAGAFASPQASTATITEIAMDNIAIGHMSMNSVTKLTGGNIAIGSQTLPVLENGGGIISIGQYSMNQFNEGYNMAIVGNGAAQKLIRGSVTTALGNSAMQNAKYSFGNVAIGSNSLSSIGKDLDSYFDADGNRNLFDNNTSVGYASAHKLEEGSGNTLLGAYTMQNLTGGTSITIDNWEYVSGKGNTAVGGSSMHAATGGSWNTALGHVTLANNTIGYNNVAVGVRSLWANTEGVENTAIGAHTLYHNTTGSINVAIGAQSLYHNTEGGLNVAIGNNAMTSNIDGEMNIAVGSNALESNISGSLNTAVGEGSLSENIGDRNTAFGHHSSGYNSSGEYNTTIGVAAARDAVNIDGAVAIGYHAMISMNNSSTLHNDNTHSHNTAVGYFAMSGDENLTNTGISNTALGYMALTSLNSGNHNTAIGSNALSNNTVGNTNIAVGDDALQSNSEGNNNIAIGKGTLSENLVSGNVGIGYNSLTLTVSGSHNVAVGEESMRSNVTGFKNVAVGASSMRSASESSNSNTTVGHDSSQYINGAYNTSIGFGSGRNIDDLTNTSNNNTFLGKMTGATDGTNTLQNSTVIGSDAEVSSDHTMVFGDQEVSKWAFGLTTTDVGKALQVGDDTTNGNGAYLTTGGTWTNGSSILFKTNFIDLSNDWILDKISKLNIRKWDYKNTNETHIGPTSEEFIELFEVGIEDENSHISTIDVSGVALKGVQALIEENQKQKEEINSQTILINELLDRIIKLESSLNE
ncbi:MAG: tail fiber domain-containing protein [Flavobacteriaceae bacterium]|jgi:hypothetical protein